MVLYSLAGTCMGGLQVQVAIELLQNLDSGLDWTVDWTLDSQLFFLENDLIALLFSLSHWSVI